MIIGEIRRYLRDNSSIRVSRSLRDTAYRVLGARERLTNAGGKEPTTDEIAKELDIPRKDVVIAMEAIMDPVSLFEPIGADNADGVCVMDQIADPKHSDTAWTETISLDEALKHLTAREQNIISMRFYEGKTQIEVASEIGISQAQVSRLEKNAVKQMRKFL